MEIVEQVLAILDFWAQVDLLDLEVVPQLHRYQKPPQGFCQISFFLLMRSSG